MSQDQRHKDLDDAGHAPRAAAGQLEPGKQPLTERASKDAAGSSAEIQRLKAEVRDAYVGENDFANQGILDHKLDAVEDLKDDLNTKDEHVGPDMLSLALTIGAAAAAGALVATGIGEGVLAGALIAGGAAAATGLPGFVDRRMGPTLNPIEFCSTYKIALRERWPGSVNHLLGQMGTLDEARKTHRQVLSMRSHVTEIRNNQMDEILDAWVNALKVAAQKGTRSPSDMGTEDFDDSTAGRLHIEGIKLDGNDDRVKVDFKDAAAQLTGVPQHARNLILDRKLDDIHVSRTIAGWGVEPQVDGARGTPLFAFGVMPYKDRRNNDHQSDRNSDHNSQLRFRADQTNVFAQHLLKRVDGAATWQDGLSRIWDMIKGRSLTELGVGNVGN